MIENYPLLKLIERRTALYTGQLSLYSIYAYLGGYSHALRDNEIKGKDLRNISFHDYVAKKLGYYESTAGWANMILAFSIGLVPKTIKWTPFFEMHITIEQHAKSVELFYKLLEEFKIEFELL